MEKNENANKRQDFAEGIIDPKTAKAVAGGIVTSTYWGEYCPYCYKHNFSIDVTLDSNYKQVDITVCCNHLFKEEDLWP